MASTPTPSPRHVVVKLPSGASARIKLSLETERLVASVLDTMPTAEVYRGYLERMIAKAADDTVHPYLVDVELALLDDLAAAGKLDCTRLVAARNEWKTAYGRLLPAAQKGAAVLTRALRTMFTAFSQVEFEKKVSTLIEGLPEDERVAALEFAEELMTSLIGIIESESDDWNADEMDYIDNHIYYQLYQDIVLPSVQLRGKELAVRRINLLSKLLRIFQF